MESCKQRNYQSAHPVWSFVALYGGPKQIRPRSIVLSFALLFATVVAGLTIRLAPVGLPAFVVKYGGSTLWALMVYWIISAIQPAKPLYANALLAGVIATAVELVKLYHSPELNAFRLTLPGILLLGRFFSFWDIVAYWLAIAAGVLLDDSMRQPLKPWSLDLGAIDLKRPFRKYKQRSRCQMAQ